MKIEKEDFDFLIRIYEDFLIDKFGTSTEFPKLQELKDKYGNVGNV